MGFAAFLSTALLCYVNRKNLDVCKPEISFSVGSGEMYEHAYIFQNKDITFSRNLPSNTDGITQIFYTSDEPACVDNEDVYNFEEPVEVKSEVRTGGCALPDHYSTIFDDDDDEHNSFDEPYKKVAETCLLKKSKGPKIKKENIKESAIIHTPKIAEYSPEDFEKDIYFDTNHKFFKNAVFHFHVEQNLNHVFKYYTLDGLYYYDYFIVPKSQWESFLVLLSVNYDLPIREVSKCIKETFNGKSGSIVLNPSDGEATYTNYRKDAPKHVKKNPEFYDSLEHLSSLFSNVPYEDSEPETI